MGLLGKLFGNGTDTEGVTLEGIYDSICPLDEVDKNHKWDFLENDEDGNIPDHWKEANDLCQSAQMYGQSEEAVEIYLRASKLGYILADYELAAIYSDSDFGGYDINKAISYYITAASEGYSPAQSELGWEYMELKNTQSGLYWTAKACRRGNAWALNNLGSFYRTGKGVKKNRRAAFLLFQEAAQKDFGWAQVNLAVCYEKGVGVEKNNDKYYEYLLKAGYNNVQQAEEILKNSLSYEKDPRFLGMIIDYLEHLTQQEDEEAMNRLAEYYSDKEDGTRDDIQRAIELYSELAENGDKKACKALSNIYLVGGGNKYVENDQLHRYWEEEYKNRK